MSKRLRLGAKVPNSGPLPFQLGAARMASMLEDAGFDSIWTSDHVVFPLEVKSRYPFSSDGRITWPVDVDYLEPTVALSAMTSTTSTAELGTSVLILPMRNPILFAKQAACIDAIAHGRLVLGVGAGWLREEFEALGADYGSRGEILDEWLAIARRCWTGEVAPFEGRHYRLAEPIYCRPTPARHLPVLIGGMSRFAQERAGKIADGWLAQYSLEGLSEKSIADGVATMTAAAKQAGRTPSEVEDFRIAVRITGADQKLGTVASRLDELGAAGATEIIVDVDWDGEGGPSRSFEMIRRRT